MESRLEREARLAKEYDEYVKKCASDDEEPINYMNWAHCKKMDEKWE